MASRYKMFLDFACQIGEMCFPNVVLSTVSKITLLCSLESCFKKTWNPLPLLVKIIHKSRLRYYGKFGLKIDYPYLVSLHFPRIWSKVEDLTPACFVGFCRICFSPRPYITFQAYFEVADQSGTMSLVLWNELCLEFYQRLTVGTVLYIQNYSLKQSYTKRSHPQMDHHRMKTFDSVGMYAYVSVFLNSWTAAYTRA